MSCTWSMQVIFVLTTSYKCYHCVKRLINQEYISHRLKTSSSCPPAFQLCCLKVYILESMSMSVSLYLCVCVCVICVSLFPIWNHSCGNLLWQDQWPVIHGGWDLRETQGWDDLGLYVHWLWQREDQLHHCKWVGHPQTTTTFYKPLSCSCG